MKLKIKTLLIFTLGFLMISANAGIIVPKKGKIEFGDVVVIKGKIYLLIQQGKFKGKNKYYIHKTFGIRLL